jgi:hypothetical protein
MCSAAVTWKDLQTKLYPSRRPVRMKHKTNHASRRQISIPKDRSTQCNRFLQYNIQTHHKCTYLVKTETKLRSWVSDRTIWPPLWSSGQSSWLQIQRSGFDSRGYHIFWEVVGLERDPHNLVSTIEELLGRKNSGSGLEIWEYGGREPSLWPHGTLYPQIWQ